MVLARTAAPLREQAVIVLRADIVRGDFQPGARLTEKHLCDRLGVSRTVVREALRQLEAERLVDILPNVGPIVRVLSVDEARALYEVREALESTAARLAALRATPEQLRLLEADLQRIREASEASFVELLEIKDHFYTTLVVASHNPAIGDMLSNVKARISQLRKLTLSTPGRMGAMTEELERIVEATRAGDAEGAQRAAAEHVRRAAALAEERLAEAAAV